MKAALRFVYGGLALGLWGLGRGVVQAGGSGPLSALDGLVMLCAAVAVLLVVFFVWGRTRTQGPLDLGKHGRRLSWSWVAAGGVCLLASPLAWGLRVEGLGIAPELGLALAAGDVLAVFLVAGGLRLRDAWAVEGALAVSVWLSLWSAWGLALAVYSWWVLVPGVGCRRPLSDWQGRPR